MQCHLYFRLDISSRRKATLSSRTSSSKIINQLYFLLQTADGPATSKRSTSSLDISSSKIKWTQEKCQYSIEQQIKCGATSSRSPSKEPLLGRTEPCWWTVTSNIVIMKPDETSQECFCQNQKVQWTPRLSHRSFLKVHHLGKIAGVCWTVLRRHVNL